MVVFEDEVRQASHETYVMTDDGSYGEQGLVTFKLNGSSSMPDARFDFVLAVGPVPMIAAVARNHQIPRHQDHGQPQLHHGRRYRHVPAAAGVLLGGQSKFACVDGPEFDASLVNFEVLMQRTPCIRDKEWPVAQALSKNIG